MLRDVFVVLTSVNKLIEIAVLVGHACPRCPTEEKVMDVLYEAHAAPQRLCEVSLTASEIFTCYRVIKFSCVRVIDSHHVKLDKVHHKDHVDVHGALSRVNLEVIIRNRQEARPAKNGHSVGSELSLQEPHQ